MAENLNNEVEAKLLEVAGRVKSLRQDMGLSLEEAAAKMELTPEEYERYEEGKEDFSFTFCYKFANLAKVDIADILEGFSPSLTEYSVTRRGQGRPIVRRADSQTKYLRLASRFKNKMSNKTYDIIHIAFHFTNGICIMTINNIYMKLCIFWKHRFIKFIPLPKSLPFVHNYLQISIILHQS